jgi:hypothetical protein
VTDVQMVHGDNEKRCRRTVFDGSLPAATARRDQRRTSEEWLTRALA